MFSNHVLGIFPDLDSLLKAIDGLKAKNLRIEDVYSPIPHPLLEGALKPRHSPIRFLTLAGGILGIVFIIGLAVYAHLQWDLITSGKPVLSWVPFVVIAFEACILFGILFNFTGMLLLGRMPRFRLPKGHDPRVTQDRFGVLISCEESSEEEASRVMRASGAEEVRRIGE